MVETKKKTNHSRNVPSGQAQSSIEDAGDPTRIVNGDTQPVHSVEISAEYIVSGVRRHVSQATAPPSAGEYWPASQPVQEDDSGLAAKYPPGQFLHVTTFSSSLCVSCFKKKSRK